MTALFLALSSGAFFAVVTYGITRGSAPPAPGKPDAPPASPRESDAEEIERKIAIEQARWRLRC